MTDRSCEVHSEHDHEHSPDCDHVAVKHENHVDYLHDGHLHFPHGDHVDEHSLEVNATNPNRCTPDFARDEHESGHEHGPDCGHESVPHGDHTDYMVAGRLHHPDGDHCDDHGPVERVLA